MRGREETQFPFVLDQQAGSENVLSIFFPFLELQVKSEPVSPASSHCSDSSLASSDSSVAGSSSAELSEQVGLLRDPFVDKAQCPNVNTRKGSPSKWPHLK